MTRNMVQEAAAEAPAPNGVQHAEGLAARPVEGPGNPRARMEDEGHAAYVSPYVYTRLGHRLDLRKYYAQHDPPEQNQEELSFFRQLYEDAMAQEMAEEAVTVIAGVPLRF